MTGKGWIPNTNDGKFKVTSEQGKRSRNGGEHHNGIDIAVPASQPLASNVQGTVEYAGTYGKGSGFNNYGNVVAVRDGNGKLHVFAHLSKVGVKAGQKVSPGDFIGNPGNTGDSDGVHLHYEVRQGKGSGYGNWVDAAPYLRGGFGDTISQIPWNTNAKPNISHPVYNNKQSPNIQFKSTGYNKAPSNVKSLINTASKQHKVSSNLIAAIVATESNYNATAKSGKGAYGLMQLMPWAGNARFDPQSNVNTGTQYIKQQLQKYGTLELALAAYNAGPGNVDKAIKKAGSSDWNKVKQHLPQETQNYIPKVKALL